jgi:hypothetical protein
MISWPAAASGYTLQDTTNLGAGWLNVATTSNHFTAPITGAAQFFRLIKAGN